MLMLQQTLQSRTAAVALFAMPFNPTAAVVLFGTIVGASLMIMIGLFIRRKVGTLFICRKVGTTLHMP